MPLLALFIVRLFLYCSVALLVLLHPGITISFDRLGLVQWFIIIPCTALAAFLPLFSGNLRNKTLLAVLFSACLSVVAAGFSLSALAPFLSGIVSFILTLLLFHYPRWGKASLAEPFFLAWVCFRLLVFSRSGEDFAQASSGLTQFILVWTVFVFLCYCALVYFCLYRGTSARAEGIVIGASTLAVLALAIFVLPENFVRNITIDNLLADRRQRMSKPVDSDWEGDTNEGNREGRRTVPRDRGGRTPTLRGRSEHDWHNNTRGNSRRRGDQRGEGDGGNGEGDNEQYTVMIVASKHDPVYMGDAVLGSFDPVEGFTSFPDEITSRLSTQRFFSTWFDHEPDFDEGRGSREVFALSTFAQRFLPYRPLSIDPTIISENSGPFRFIHRVVSNVHLDNPLALLLKPVRKLDVFEQSSLAPYLELPLGDEDRALFTAQLDRAWELWDDSAYKALSRNEYLQTIAAILYSFSEYQYNVNMINYCSVADMGEFLTITKDGDCVLFSNTAALLGRLAGIPSRVVTGFLASSDLQMPAHRQGLAALRRQIPVLQEFPLRDLFLVTDAHGHSWTQFYIPDYGWIDFEATMFAIPPTSSFGNGNLRDVVIPLLDDGPQVISAVRAFPWRTVLRVLALLAVLALSAAYVLRYGREAVLYMAARRGGQSSARALYLLLLSRLAADGKPIKPMSKTAPEYAALFSGIGNGQAFTAFSSMYTELRYRSFSNTAEVDERLRSLRTEYGKILRETKRKGMRAALIRALSLRGLWYL